jgi:hypothetical protein
MNQTRTTNNERVGMAQGSETMLYGIASILFDKTID